MSATDTPPTTELAATSQAPASYERCDQCGSPVEAAQRYCVVCGAHRRHVHDPAAQYLARGAARGGASTAVRASAPRGRRSNLGIALALVAVPLALALGLLVGRASTSGDAKLIAALRAQKPEVITTGGGAGTAASTTSASTVSTTSTAKHGKTVAAASTGKVLSSTSYGTANQIAGTKPTQSDLAQGEQVVRHIQATEGKSYVNAQKNLPSQISIP